MNIFTVLTNIFVGINLLVMQLEAQIIRNTNAIASLSHPTRLKILKELMEPYSATDISKRLDVPRQKVAYHFKELEKHKLIELVEERKKGNCTERILRASARAYTISSEVLGPVELTPDKTRDQFSWTFLVAILSKAVKDLGILRSRANRVGKKLSTLSLQTEIKFESQEKQQQFMNELFEQVSNLSAKYNSSGKKGRIFNLVLGSYPKITK